jgi:hypothetical protein
VNYCTSSDQDFSSVAALDRHRIGKHEYSHVEGLRSSLLARTPGACMSVDAMNAVGHGAQPRGRWYDVDAAERVCERFAEAA